MRDGNCHVQIIGVRFCKGETKKDYVALLRNLQECVFHDEEPVVFADRRTAYFSLWIGEED